MGLLYHKSIIESSKHIGNRQRPEIEEPGIYVVAQATLYDYEYPDANWSTSSILHHIRSTSTHIYTYDMPRLQPQPDNTKYSTRTTTQTRPDKIRPCFMYHSREKRH